MQELIINKRCNTKEEEDALVKELGEKYIVFMYNHFSQVLGEPEIYGIESIFHCGERN